MDYRDERDALRGRVENLEQDLASAKEKLGDHSDEDRQKRIDEIERQMTEARRLLDGLGTQLEAMRSDPKSRTEQYGVPGRVSQRSRQIAIMLVLGTLCLVAGFAFISRGIAPRPPPVAQVDEPARVAPPEPPPAAVDPPPIPPAEPVPDPPAAIAKPPVPEGTHATARWNAKVTRATGRPISAGSTCVVEASLVGTGSAIHTPKLTVECGGARVYDSEDALNGMSMSGSGVEEDAGDRAGTYLYALDYHDKGARSGKRSEISLNSIAKSGAVWSDTAPAFRVELAMPYQSEPVTGEALLDATRGTLRRGAVVRQVTGASPAHVGARCSVRVAPKRSGRCLVRLKCGQEMLYGAGTFGVAECTMEAGRVTHVSDTNPTPRGGDPEIDIDPAAGTMVLADEVGTTRWSATFALDTK